MSHAIPTDVHAPADRGLLARSAFMLYGLLAYASFFVTILYAIGFVANVGVPKGIDDGAPGAVLPSLAINGALLVLFVVQHTVMARPWFKRRWTRLVPEPMERSTFVIASSACLGLLFWAWQPLPQVIWDVETPVLRYALVALSMSGWAIVFLSSFMINHFDLFGLRQTYLRFRDRAYQPLPFRIVGLYRLVRHPLMLGFLIAFWATPTMSLGHLFFAVMVTGYIVLGVRIEERDLVAYFGEKYLAYRRSVPSLLPFPRRG